MSGLSWSMGIAAGAKLGTLLGSHFPNELAEEKQDLPQKQKQHSSRRPLVPLTPPLSSIPLAELFSFTIVSMLTLGLDASDRKRIMTSSLKSHVNSPYPKVTITVLEVSPILGQRGWYGTVHGPQRELSCYLEQRIECLCGEL